MHTKLFQLKHLLRLFLLLLPVFVLKPLFAQSTGTIHIHIPGDQLYACWSPDGQRLVYQSNQKGNWDLFLYDLQTGHSEELADSSTDEQHPVWVPGKQAVIFEMGNGKNSRLYLLKMPDGKKKLLIPRNIPSLEASLTPSRHMIAFSGWDAISESWQIYTYDFIYDNLNQLSRENGNATFPVFSRDGKTIAYKSLTAGGIDRLHLMNWYGENKHILPLYSKGIITWAPSGWRFYGVIQNPESGYEICSWHRDGSGQQIIYQSMNAICCPSLSPDGKHLAFSQQTSNGFDIFIIPVQE